jgi:hypothetical protein
MSTLSDAWRACPPAIRDFYVNNSALFTFHLWHADDPWNPPARGVFYTIGQSFIGHRGFDIFCRNMTSQLYLTGSFDPQITLLDVAMGTFDGRIEPYYDLDHFYSFAPPPDLFPDFIVNYPRAKYRVRRSYWTGAPRHRRNL